jgi:hypothetical protein
MHALADVVWPSLFLAERMLSWWIIAAGLVIEFFFVRWLTGAVPGRAALMTLVMNAISTAAGVVAIPISGLAWELIASVSLLPLMNWGTFNPVTWLVSAVLAALVNAVIEVGSLRLIFKVPLSKRLFWWLAVANFITAGMALASLMIVPPKY